MKEKRVKENETLEFWGGILLLAAGLFMLAMKVRVYSGWFAGFTIGAFRIASGVVTIPLIIGIILYTINPGKFFPKLICILGTIFIIVSIIMSTTFQWVSTTLFEYLLIFILSAVGTGLILKTVLSDKKENEEESK